MSYWRKCLSTGEYQYIATGEPAPEDIKVPWWEVDLARKDKRIAELEEHVTAVRAASDDVIASKDKRIAALEQYVDELEYALQAYESADESLRKRVVELEAQVQKLKVL